MPSSIENIYQTFLADPNFELGKPEKEKQEIAWKLAWERYRQTERNNVALSMAKENMTSEHLNKESVGTAGPDSGASKYPAKIGGPTTIGNTKKFGQERINLHRDPNRTWRTRPETAFEVTSDKELEKISPVAAAKKLFGKPQKTLEELEIERMHRDFGYTKKGEIPLNKREQFKAYLKKHLTDTLDEEEFQPQENEMLEENADAEMMSETAVTIDTIINALSELQDKISQHELDEMTGQEDGGLELFESIEKHKREQPHYHPYSETGPGIDVEAYRKPKSLIPKGKKFLYMPGTKPYLDKHYTGPGGKHEHLESGQWVRPGMKTVPGKTWGGKVLAKKDFKDLDFKDQDAVKAEAEMFAQGKLKKPVAKQIDSRGKSGAFNVQGAASNDPWGRPYKPYPKRQGPSRPKPTYPPIIRPKPVLPDVKVPSKVEKHEDFYMHRHGPQTTKNIIPHAMTHLLPPSPKIKIEPVKKNVKTGGYPEPGQREAEWRPALSEKESPSGWTMNKPAASKKESRDFARNYPFKKDTSSIHEITEVQKKCSY